VHRTIPLPRRDSGALCLSLLMLPFLAVAQSRPPRRVPPMFSQAYVNALRGIVDLEPRDVTALQDRLAKNPNDFAARLKLMAYSMRADRAALPESRNQRAELALWLVEHRPDSEILASPYASFSAGDLSPDRQQRAAQLWDRATRAHPANARMFGNAANFYRRLDAARHLSYLERAVALAPDDIRNAQALGLLYAGAILSADPQSLYRDPGGPNADLARRATQVLDTTRNALLIEPAVRLLQRDYSRSLMLGHANASLGALAHRYFDRARALDPNLDAAFVYPQIDPKMIGMLAQGAEPPPVDQAQIDAAATEIRRLSPDAFPELPAPIRTALRRRGCTIPQPAPVQTSGDGPRANVIRGDFFAPGQPAWAVLCSVAGSSSILVFRGGSGAAPAELAKYEDRIYLQDFGTGKAGYDRQIRPVNRKFIVERYRAYGGPKPPSIDHQGIDDKMLEKVSVVHYWYGKQWLELTGSD
jgi:hypothetical protein